MTLTVNFARADQSFVDVCPSCLGKSLHTRTQSFPARASLHGRNLDSPNCLVATVIRLRFRAIFASSGNAEIATLVSYVHAEFDDQGAVI